MQLDFNNAISSDNIKEIKSLIKVTWSRLDALQSFLEEKTIDELLPVEENKTDEDPKVFWNN
jgi:ribosomal protein L12E/L44/L45/RPP1/RPP2